MSSKKQTAVDQLRERLFYEFGFSYSDNIHQELKAIEKEQIIYAFGQGSLFDPVFPNQFHYRADDYYQHHYGQ
jgi:hypothetical protein